MGNLVTKFDQHQEQVQNSKKQLSLNLPQESSTQTFLFSVHKQFNPQNCTLVQFIISNQQQKKNIKQNIRINEQLQKSDHKHSSYPISILKQVYLVEKSGYCSGHEICYLLFEEPANNYRNNLKDQFNIRRVITNKQFKIEQILTILKVYLISVKVYFEKFNRTIQKIDLDDICFRNYKHNNISTLNKNINMNNHNHKEIKNQNSEIYFIDPYIKEKKQQQKLSVNEFNILFQNPSPERLQQYSSEFLYNQQSNNNDEDYKNKKVKKLNSILFSIGVIGLKLLQMSLVDDIYTKIPTKSVNFIKINQYLNKHKGVCYTKQKKNYVYSFSSSYNPSIKSVEQMKRDKLMKGLQILLSINGKQRAKIYMIWSELLTEKREYTINRETLCTDEGNIKQRKNKHNININNNINKYIKQYIRVPPTEYQSNSHIHVNNNYINSNSNDFNNKKIFK